jgi:hypothetical protein
MNSLLQSHFEMLTVTQPLDMIVNFHRTGKYMTVHTKARH